MNPTAIRVVSFSPTHTSLKIAQAVARGAANRAGALPTDATPIHTLDLTHTAAPETTFASDEVVIFAVPVYGGHIAPTARQRIETLHGNQTPAVVVVVYGNRDIGKAALELSELTSAHGFKTIAAAAFVGEHSYSTELTPIAVGRPDARDLAEATAFGAAVRLKLGSGATPVEVKRLRIPSTPLWPLLRFIRFVIGYQRRQKRTPVVYLPQCDAEACTHCGKCAALCPTGAITRGDECHTDPARCIRCCACVKGCPVGARTFSTPFAAALSRNFAQRKAPTTLL